MATLDYKVSTQEFLEAIFFKEYFNNHDGFVEIRKINPDVKQYFFKRVEDIAHKDWHGNTYFGVCPRETKNGTKEAVKYITALWCDVDRSEAEAFNRYNEFPHKASIIVSSGNGFHFYWLLKELDEATTKHEGVMKGISKYLGGDSTYDLARVMRLPGTLNVKDASSPKPVEVITFAPELRYNLSDFEQFEKEIIKVDIEKINGSKDVDISKVKIDEEWRQTITTGKHPSREYKSRSEQDQAVMNVLVRNEIKPEILYGIFHNKKYAISEKTLENGDPYFNLTYSKAKEYTKEKEPITKAVIKPKDMEKTEVVANSAVTLQDVKEVILRHFPRYWEMVEMGLANFATLLLKNNSNCSALVFEGDSSTGKSTVLKMFYPTKETQDILYRSDDFTPKSFVSHHANKSEKERLKADMLPKINKKMLVYSDLQTLLSKREEDQTELLGMLGKVLDGEGLTRDTGMCGQRGYTGDNYIFATLFATTPIGWKSWEIMSRCGTRLMFFKIDKSSLGVEELKRGLKDDFYDSEISYTEKVKECREVVQRFLVYLWRKNSGFGGVEFKDSQVKENVKDDIATLAVFTTRARGQLVMWEIKESEGEFAYEPPRIELPERIMRLLLNLGKGRALIYGRNEVNEEDYACLKHIAISSMPQARYALIRQIMKNGGKVSTYDINQLSISYRVLLRGLHELVALGLTDWVSEDDVTRGRPHKTVKLKAEFPII